MSSPALVDFFPINLWKVPEAQLDYCLDSISEDHLLSLAPDSQLGLGLGFVTKGAYIDLNPS